MRIVEVNPTKEAPVDVKPKIEIVAVVELFGVIIEGRGGDSAEWHYFEKVDDAVLAAAADGTKNPSVATVVCWQLSDGRYCRVPAQIWLSQPPTPEQVAQVAGSVSPAQLLALERARPRA